MSGIDANNAITILRDIFWVGFHDKGNITNFISIKEDITERKQKEEELKN